LPSPTRRRDDVRLLRCRWPASHSSSTGSATCVADSQLNWRATDQCTPRGAPRFVASRVADGLRASCSPRRPHDQVSEGAADIGHQPHFLVAIARPRPAWHPEGIPIASVFVPGREGVGRSGVGKLLSPKLGVYAAPGAPVYSAGCPSHAVSQLPGRRPRLGPDEPGWSQPRRATTVPLPTQACWPPLSRAWGPRRGFGRLHRGDGRVGGIRNVTRQARAPRPEGRCAEDRLDIAEVGPAAQHFHRRR
jgi:hypothetical protein